MNFNGYYLTVFFNTYRKCFRCKYISLRRLNFSNNVFAVFNVLKGKFAVFICCNRFYSFIGWKIGFTIGEQSDNCPCKRFVGFSDLNTFDIAPDFFITDFYSNYLVIFTDRNRECFFCKNISCRGLNLGNNIFSVYYVLENKFAVFFSGNRCKSVFSSEFGFAVGEQSDNCAA